MSPKECESDVHSHDQWIESAAASTDPYRVIRACGEQGAHMRTQLNVAHICIVLYRRDQNGRAATGREGGVPVANPPRKPEVCRQTTARESHSRVSLNGTIQTVQLKTS